MKTNVSIGDNLNFKSNETLVRDSGKNLKVQTRIRAGLKLLKAV